MITRLTVRALRATFGLAVAALAIAACNDDDDNMTGPGGARVFNQIERLGQPLVAEVFLAKRDHDFHDAGNPATDRANFKVKVAGFITGVAGRDAAYANTVADALLPDMITVQTDKAPTTAGYLQHVLTNGYGGRKLADDAVDLSLMVVFGNALGNTANVSPGLVTDNVPSDSPFQAAFPYLAPRN